MNEVNKFGDIFDRKLESTKQAQLRFVTCKSVNWDKKTMTAVGNSDNVPYEGVQLGFGYIDIKPKAETLCLIGILEGKEVETFLINAEDVELVEIKVSNTVTINSGENGGLVKIAKLTQQLNTLEKDLNSLKTAFSSWVTVPQDGGAALKAATATWAGQTLAATQQADIENEKIKH
jgi:hypothetical protein